MIDIFDTDETEKLLQGHRATLDRWIETALRRDEQINKNCPYCPQCGDRQVQIKSKDVPAQWKCRMCKHRFQFEPSWI